jgi:hypothetical protein
LGERQKGKKEALPITVTVCSTLGILDEGILRRLFGESDGFYV